ncbi:MAG: lysine--tRNA ligase [Acidobacteria bacterium]|nr:lysine--tRNA ligase [Acidobacteriota bacterium]
MPLFDEENDQIIQRRKNLQAITELGFEAYPHKFDRTHTVSEIVHHYADRGGQRPAEELEKVNQELNGIKVRLAGRIMTSRLMGKAGFIHLSDGASRLQAYVRSNDVPVREWQLFKLLDLGDIVGVEGWLFITRTGELSVHVRGLSFLAKALLPMPEKYHGLQDVESRHRQRYLDLIANPSSREVFVKRAAIIREVRSFFDDRGYIEVETPMLSPIASGAAARPFKTHHNALDIDLFARVAPELYLKRLVVGGFEKVYELNRNFRNEGLSARHNPEFTMLEFYQAYSDYEQLMELTEELITGVVERVHGSLKLSYAGVSVDFTPPWKRVTMIKAVLDALLDQDDSKDLKERALVEVLAAEDPQFVSSFSPKEIVDLFDHFVEPRLIDPTFITGFPTEVSPLSKQSETNPGIVHRFELFICGLECANAFCELNDPAEQERRFKEQMDQRGRGVEEVVVMDEDYVRALGYGLPPTAGEGIGIDRLTMIITGQANIRDVILFPHMRPESK